MQFISAIICLPLPLHMSYLQSPWVHTQQSMFDPSLSFQYGMQARCCLYPQPSTQYVALARSRDIHRIWEWEKLCQYLRCIHGIFINIYLPPPYFTRFILWCWQVGIRNLLRWRSQDGGYAKEEEEDLRWEITAEMRFHSHQGGPKLCFYQFNLDNCALYSP